MKRISFSLLTITVLSFILVQSCSTEEDLSVPTVQKPELEQQVKQYTLTVTSAEGGTVSTEGGIYDDGTELTITATPNEGYGFVGWEGNDSTNSDLIITLSSNQTYEAIFKKEYNYEYNQLDLNEPPFYASMYITGGIITSSDPSLFDKIEYNGVFERLTYDRRLETASRGGSVQREVYVYTNYYSDGTKIETLVNLEFTQEESRVITEKMAFLIGQLPYALRRDLKVVNINKGLQTWGGGADAISITDGGLTEHEINFRWPGFSYDNNYVADINQEVLIHEAAHVAFDWKLYPDRLTDGEKWLEAVALDGGCYISDYARDNPLYEDIAETFLLYIAVRYFPERIPDDIRDKILSCSYNRIKYFDSLGLDMSLYEN